MLKSIYYVALMLLAFIVLFPIVILSGIFQNKDNRVALGLAYRDIIKCINNDPRGTK